MRNLIVHRERALACFAMKYHCILDKSVEEMSKELENPEGRLGYLTGEHPGISLANGGTLALEMDEGPHTLFVMACLEARTLYTQLLTLEPGKEDAYALVTTEFDGYHHPSLKLEEVRD